MTIEHIHHLTVYCDRKLSPRCWQWRSYRYSTQSACSQAAYKEGWREIGKEPYRTHSCEECREKVTEQKAKTAAENGHDAPSL